MSSAIGNNEIKVCDTLLLWLNTVHGGGICLRVSDTVYQSFPSWLPPLRPPNQLNAFRRLGELGLEGGRELDDASRNTGEGDRDT